LDSLAPSALFNEALVEFLIMSIPIQTSIPPPTRATIPITKESFKTGPRPKTSATTSNSSRIAWPVISKGPALKPIRADSETVTVRSGPGIKAPDKAKAKEPENMVASSSKGLSPFLFLLALLSFYLFEFLCFTETDLRINLFVSFSLNFLYPPGSED